MSDDRNEVRANADDIGKLAEKISQLEEKILLLEETIAHYKTGEKSAF